MSMFFRRISVLVKAFTFKCPSVLEHFPLDYFKAVGRIILRITPIQRIHVGRIPMTRFDRWWSFVHLEGNARAERYQQELISHILLGIAIAVILFIIFNWSSLFKTSNSNHVDDLSFFFLSLSSDLWSSSFFLNLHSGKDSQRRLFFFVFNFIKKRGRRLASALFAVEEEFFRSAALASERHFFFILLPSLSDWQKQTFEKIFLCFLFFSLCHFRWSTKRTKLNKQKKSHVDQRVSYPHADDRRWISHRPTLHDRRKFSFRHRFLLQWKF